MKTDNTLESILNELYMLDPQLKKQETQLKKLIEKLLESKPDLKIDEHFIQQLREKINSEANSQKEVALDEEEKTPSMHWLKKLLMPFATGVLATALVIVMVQNLGPLSPERRAQDDLNLDFSKASEIVERGPNAFGHLSEFARDDSANENQPSIPASTSLKKEENLESQNDADATPPSLAMEVKEAEQAPASSVAIANPTVATGLGGGGAMMEDKMIVAPDYIPTIYKYTYNGEPIDLESKVNVFKRINQKSTASSLANAIKNLGFGIMDLSGFNNLEIESINVTQNIKEGYMLSLNFNESSLSLYQNWNMWDYPGTSCGDNPKCYEEARLKKEDILSDTALRQISDAFLKQHKVNLDLYGEPVVQKYWEREYELARRNGLDESSVYVPETITLVYPLLIEGRPTFDQGGNPMGLSVSVSLYHKKVSAVYNLKIDQFERSAYEGITDWQTITDYLSNGATPFKADYGEMKTREIQVELEAPELILMNSWKYDANESNEFFTPALRFKIIPPQDEIIYQDYVVVPLAKELLYPYGMELPPIMPLESTRPATPPIDPPESPTPEPATTSKNE